MVVTLNILKDISNCDGLLLQDVIIGILKEGMDLVNYIIILGWRCMHKGIKPSDNHFRKILENEYETEQQIALKSNRMGFFFVINAKPMRSYFKRTLSCKYV